MDEAEARRRYEAAGMITPWDTLPTNQRRMIGVMFDKRDREGSWPRHADGQLKKPDEFTEDERRALDRRIDARIEHERATADYGSDEIDD